MRRYAIVALMLLLSALPVSAQTKKPIVKPVLPIERAEALLPRVTVSADGRLLPDLRAAAAIVYDPVTGEVLYESHADDQRSIASITKVMTASVFMESYPDLSEMVTVEPADMRNASHTYLMSRDRLSVDDLLHLMLIGSDNAAARVLARISPLGTTEFITRMNEKAEDLGLEQTHYADTSGLLKGNVSTAYDTARLLVDVSTNGYISSVMQMPKYSFRTAGKRLVSFQTTDHLLMHDVPVMAAKTGFTNPAGFCLASLLRLPNAQTIAIVVLGAQTNAERFIEVENLYQWLTMHAKIAQLDVQDVIPAAHLSDRGLTFIKEAEGFHATPYWDSGGYAVGYGFHRWHGLRVTKVYPRHITRADADDEFRKQLTQYENVVTAAIVSPLSQSAYDALVSVAYNLGRINSEIIAKLSAGQGVTPRDFLATATVHNRPNAVLESRRMREFVLFAGDYTGVLLSTK